MIIIVHGDCSIVDGCGSGNTCSSSSIIHCSVGFWEAFVVKVGGVEYNLIYRVMNNGEYICGNKQIVVYLLVC